MIFYSDRFILSTKTIRLRYLRLSVIFDDVFRVFNRHFGRNFLVQEVGRHGEDDVDEHREREETAHDPNMKLKIGLDKDGLYVFVVIGFRG